MSPAYVPKTEDQLAKEGLLPEGIYDFEIIETSDRPSKKGNEMIMLKLCVFDTDGSQHYIFDYIVFGSNFGERKLRKAAEACGLMEIYDSGHLNDRSFFGATGKVLLKRQDGNGEFPPKNVVGEYCPREAEAAPAPRSSREITGDDIPF